MVDVGMQRQCSSNAMMSSTLMKPLPRSRLSFLTYPLGVTRVIQGTEEGEIVEWFFIIF